MQTISLFQPLNVKISYEEIYKGPGGGGEGEQACGETDLFATNIIQENLTFFGSNDNLVDVRVGVHENRRPVLL